MQPRKTQSNRVRPAAGLAAGILTLLVCAGAARAAGGVIVDRIVAVVNEDIITQFDMEAALQPMAAAVKKQGLPPEQERRTLDNLRRDLLETLVENKLTEQEVKRYKITVTEEEISAYIQQIRQRRSFSEQDLQAALASQGMSMEDYRREVRAQIERTKLVNREVRAKVVITREEIQAYYDRNSAKYGGGGKQVHLWNLMVRLPRGAGSEEAAKARAALQEALAEVKGGRAFEEVARRLADGSRGVQGTDLGLFRVADLTPELREAVGKLKPGEFSPPIETEFGVQSVYVQKVADAPGRPLSEVEAEIQEILYREYVESKFKSWIADLRKRSVVKIMEPY
jgi:peptidyl-prolyl cis-trans isomerase SurA